MLVFGGGGGGKGGEVKLGRVRVAQCGGEREVVGVGSCYIGEKKGEG